MIILISIQLKLFDGIFLLEMGTTFEVVIKKVVFSFFDVKLSLVIIVKIKSKLLFALHFVHNFFLITAVFGNDLN